MRPATSRALTDPIILTGQEQGEAAAMAMALAAAVVKVYANHDAAKVAADLKDAMVATTFWRRLVFVQHDECDGCSLNRRAYTSFECLLRADFASSIRKLPSNEFP